MLSLILVLVFLIGCSSQELQDVDALETEEVTAAVPAPGNEDVEEMVVVDDSDESTDESEEEVTRARVSLNDLSTEKPVEGTCNKVAVQWAGCDKMGNSNTDLTISMLNGGKTQLPGFYLYYKMKDGSYYYQDYKSIIILNDTTTYPLNIEKVEALNGGINKIYVYPRQEIDGVMTVCKALPIGVFIPATNCKGVTNIDSRY